MAHECIELEKTFLKHTTRTDHNILESLISRDFIEFGSSGKIYYKQDVMRTLISESIRNFKAVDFEVRILSENCVLITYKLFESMKSTLRSSIWIRNTHNSWQIIFHQGTNCSL